MPQGSNIFTLLLVNKSSSPRSFFHETTCPPCKLTWIADRRIIKMNQEKIYQMDTKINDQHKQSTIERTRHKSWPNSKTDREKGINGIVSHPSRCSSWHTKNHLINSVPVLHHLQYRVLIPGSS